MPVDSVIQCVEPKPRLLLCFRVELPSQEGYFHREYVTFRPFGRTLVLSQFFRSRLLVQAVLLLVSAACISAGPLRSTRFPVLQRYYEPIRLPAVPLALMPSLRLSGLTHTTGSLRFLASLSVRAAPSHPHPPTRPAPPRPKKIAKTLLLEQPRDHHRNIARSSSH